MSYESAEFKGGMESHEMPQPTPIELPEPQREVLPDGREALVSGNPEGCESLNHFQGENLQGFETTCGLVACEGILRQFGVEAKESDLLEHALESGHCDVLSGHTSLADQVSILEDFGIPAHSEHNGTVEGLADKLEHGQCAIIEVNSGALWNQPSHYGNGEASHAVLVTGIARDPETSAVIGAFYNDSATGESGKFVPRDVLEAAWTEAGGKSVVTEFNDVRDTERTIGDWVWYNGHWISF
jgi:hypothetical protein